jgi:hypothetical protein
MFLFCRALSFAAFYVKGQEDKRQSLAAVLQKDTATHSLCGSLRLLYCPLQKKKDTTHGVSFKCFSKTEREKV